MYVLYALPALVIGVLWIVRYRNAAKARFFQSMNIDENDPILKKMAQVAQDRLAEFNSLLIMYPNDAYLKIAHTTPENQIEHVWGRVVKQISPEQYWVEAQIFIAGANALARKAFIVQASDIEDWQVSAGHRIHGGFSTQYMFWLRRKEMGYLPGFAQRILHLYTDPVDDVLLQTDMPQETGQYVNA